MLNLHQWQFATILVKLQPLVEETVRLDSKSESSGAVLRASLWQQPSHTAVAEHSITISSTSTHIPSQQMPQTQAGTRGRGQRSCQMLLSTSKSSVTNSRELGTLNSVSCQQSYADDVL
jgi:hypothetical protein